MRRVLFKHFLVLFNGDTTINGFGLDIGSIFSESFELFLDLVSQFASVTQHQGTLRFWIFLQTVQHSDAEDSGLTHTSLSLAKQIVTQKCVRNALLLHFRRMFKGGISNGTVQFGQQEEILKAGRVDAGVTFRFLHVVGLDLVILFL